MSTCEPVNTGPSDAENVCIRSEKPAKADDWRHVKIVLESVNPEFQPIELTTEDEEAVAVVAELVEVIGSEPSEW